MTAAESWKKQRELRRLTTACSRSDEVHCLRVRYVTMFRRSLLLGLAAIAATSVAALPASAQRPRDLATPWAPGGDEQREEQRRDVPLSSVIRDLRRQYGGQHLDASKVGDRYVIAWVTEEGKRLTIEVDAATGRTISVR
jgi:hypothetical protein